MPTRMIFPIHGPGLFMPQTFVLADHLTPGISQGLEQ